MRCFATIGTGCHLVRKDAARNPYNCGAASISADSSALRAAWALRSPRPWQLSSRTSSNPQWESFEGNLPADQARPSNKTGLGGAAAYCCTQLKNTMVFLLGDLRKTLN
jgi:hypothetical protein